MIGMKIWPIYESDIWSKSDYDCLGEDESVFDHTLLLIRKFIVNKEIYGFVREPGTRIARTGCNHCLHSEVVLAYINNCRTLFSTTSTPTGQGLMSMNTCWWSLRACVYNVLTTTVRPVEEPNPNMISLWTITFITYQCRLLYDQGR